jgi:N-acetylmuramoyl-L-alanine amidase
VSGTLRLQRRQSPNFNARPPKVRVDAIILHADAAQTVAQSLSWMMVRESRVSYHYLIGRMGDVYQLVDDDKRAWHAGVSSFRGRGDCNDYSLGVSFGNRNDGVEPYREDQLAAGVRLCAELIARFPAITLERITTHADVAQPPGRKTDPGPCFPLQEFVARVGRLVGRVA